MKEMSDASCGCYSRFLSVRVRLIRLLRNDGWTWEEIAADLSMDAAQAQQIEQIFQDIEDMMKETGGVV